MGERTVISEVQLDYIKAINKYGETQLQLHHIWNLELLKHMAIGNIAGLAAITTLVTMSENKNFVSMPIWIGGLLLSAWFSASLPCFAHL